MNAGYLMKESSMLLDKFSSPNNHPLLIAKIVHEKLKQEISSIDHKISFLKEYVIIFK